MLPRSRIESSTSKHHRSYKRKPKLRRGTKGKITPIYIIVGQALGTRRHNSHHIHVCLAHPNSKSISLSRAPLRIKPPRRVSKLSVDLSDSIHSTSRTNKRRRASGTGREAGRYPGAQAASLSLRFSGCLSSLAALPRSAERAPGPIISGSSTNTTHPPKGRGDEPKQHVPRERWQDDLHPGRPIYFC